MKHNFKSRKEASKYLAEKGVDTSNWTEEKWLSINKGQAEIHMMALAEVMWDALNESTPKQLEAGEWHIPFGNNINTDDLHDYGITFADNHYDIDNLKIKVASAMNARISYTVVGEEGKEPNYENDIKLHDRLVQSGHWSPMEHCAQAMNYEEYHSNICGYAKQPVYSMGHEVENGYTEEKACGWSGNFRGFIQYRKTFNNENIVK
jgi:thymidylate synthase ThyX